MPGDALDVGDERGRGLREERGLRQGGLDVAGQREAVLGEVRHHRADLATEVEKARVGPRDAVLAKEVSRHQLPGDGVDVLLAQRQFVQCLLDPCQLGLQAKPGRPRRLMGRAGGLVLAWLRAGRRHPHPVA